MILVTVGAQMPFDRMVEAVDSWAAARGRSDLFAQVGEASYTPKHLQWSAFTTPAEFRRLVEEAELIVAHAGMGTIITALELGKPILVMPRRAALRETRSDHQVATARQLSLQGLVNVAWDERELLQKLDHEIGRMKAADKVANHASSALCETVASFIKRPRSGAVDGVICFGTHDWWYHNRGHYDVQMMREFSRRMPVLYVNSIGMRTPQVGEGRVFAKRVARKVRSWSRGFTVVREGFAVLSPVSVPKFHGTRLARALLAEQVRDAAASMGMRHPLVWVACPPAAEVLERIPSAGVVYQRTDRFEHFPGVDSAKIRGYDLALKEEADLTVFCSSSVYDDEKAECRSAAFIDHGVDFREFVAAGDGGVAEPEDMREIPRPRIGFVGGIDAWTFDPSLFNEVAGAMPDCAFVLVGGCSLPEGWCGHGHVHLLGRKPYEQVAAYMAACDVLIMPWNKSEWIKACNPVKLKEYLAVGRPVVSTSFDELKKYDGYIQVADDAASFVAKIREALAAPVDKDRLRRRVEAETWAAKASLVVDGLKKARVEFSKAAEHAPLVQDSARDATVESHAASQESPAPAEAAPVRLPTSRGRLRTGWRKRHVIGAVVMALIGAWVTKDAWLDIFRIAGKDEESSHIWLVLPVALWLVWVRKEQALTARRTATYVGPLLVALGWLFYAVGDIQLYQSMWHFGAIVVTVGCLLSVLGGHVLMRLWPAFAVLAFMVPVPNIVRQQISMPLQNVTAQVTASILQFLGTPVTLSGNVLVINDVTVGIAEACNGVRMVFALTLVCFLYAFGSDLSNRARLFVLAASPLVAIGANVVRLVPTVWLYGYSSESTALAFHDFSGWAMMPISLLALVAFSGLLRWIRGPEGPPKRDLATVATSRA